MDRDVIVALLPHYAVMLVLVFAVLSVWRAFVGDLGFWGELVIIIVIVFAYRPVVKRLGFAPEPWQD